MHPHHPPAAHRWDGTPLDKRRHRSLRVTATSPSRLLRTGQHRRCRDCGNPVDWYQRSDHRLIALHPAEVTTTAVPASCRWHVSCGIAYRHADHDTWCRIPHAVLCPSRTALTRLTPHLRDARRQLAVRTRTFTDTGTFTPPAPRPPHARQHQFPGRDPDRPVVQILHIRYLAQHPVKAIQCVAQLRTRHRCRQPVLDTRAPAGTWILQPATTGTHRQLALPAGCMALYDLSFLPYAEQLRWRTQRCPLHATASTAPDLALAEWQVFDPLLHHTHLHTRLPQASADRPGEALA